MTQQERHGWFIVASLFVILLLVFGGGYNTVPVLLPALLKGFPHWSHQRVSILPSVLAASAGVSVLPVGWLVDRIEARIVMAIGALTVGVAFIIASQSNSLAPMIAVYLLVGIGIAAGTVLPGALVLANWFTARRGMAMGIANAGSTTGGMVMTWSRATPFAIANDASASAKKKTAAAKPKGAPASKTGKAAGRPPRSSRAKSNDEKLICRYCGSDDLAPSFKRRRDARCGQH